MLPSKKPHIFHYAGWWYCGLYGRMINGCASGGSPEHAWRVWCLFQTANR
jgi:pentatricopeptide repeat protein